MQRIKLYRQKAGLTQSELANMLGIDRSAVTKWENNISYPRFKLLTKFRIIDFRNFNAKVRATLAPTH